MKSIKSALRKIKHGTKKAGQKIMWSAGFCINNLFGKKYCPVCGSHIIKFKRVPNDYIDRFYRTRFIHSIFCFEGFDIKNHSCPVCGANESARMYALYLRKRLSDIKEPINFVEFAPDKIIANIIKSYKNIKYRSADLYLENVDDTVDLMDMKMYKDNMFDMLMCTHVLEHVENDRKAMSELYRILKPGGEAIIQVPIMLTLEKDYENPSITSPQDRWKHFGEKTHARMYSKSGFVSKLTGAGFKVNQLGVDYFGKEAFDKCALGDTLVLYVSKK